MNSDQKRTPALFVGHGSPMNALQDNKYTRALREFGKSLRKPRGVLSISAHWLTPQVSVTHMLRPKTLHDFYGFPDQLYQIQYPAPGDPILAEEVRSLLKDEQVVLDDTDWGLDHGTWSVLRHLFPAADIPVVQLGISIHEQPEFHLNVGRKLIGLRDRGVMLLGSGNIVHNLNRICWEEDADPFQWAIDFDEAVKNSLIQRDFAQLLTAPNSSPAGRLSVPTPEHYFPLHYITGASILDDRLEFICEGIQNASISMRTFVFR